MGELSEIPPVPPPAQFDTMGGGAASYCSRDLCDPTLVLNENIWVKNACQTLPNTKFRQQRAEK